jgi:glucoamylase
MLDVYVAGGRRTGIAVRVPQRNYTIHGDSAWTQRVGRGSAPVVWMRLMERRSPAGPVACRYITVRRPGTQDTWCGVGVHGGLTGRTDSADQARASRDATTVLRRCWRRSADPRCRWTLGSCLKAMDVITPAGIDQATELDVTLGPVVIRGAGAATPPARPLLPDARRCTRRVRV